MILTHSNFLLRQNCAIPAGLTTDTRFDSNVILTSIFKTIKDPSEIDNIKINVSLLSAYKGNCIFTNLVNVRHNVNLTPPFNIWKVLVVAFENMDYIFVEIFLCENVFYDDCNKAQKESNQNVNW